MSWQGMEAAKLWIWTSDGNLVLIGVNGIGTFNLIFIMFYFDFFVVSQENHFVIFDIHAYWFADFYGSWYS